jgi:tripartite ATP-independent transporter DctP family solute receptor
MAGTLQRGTAGRITMEIHPAAQLGSEKETIEMCKLGQLDINRVSSSPLAEFAPQAGVYSLPYLFRGEAHMWKVLEGPIGREVLDSLEPHGFIGLCYYDSGARSFYNSKRPINTPGDLHGLKMRVQKNRVMQDCVQALGASPVSMAFEEAYSALQTGVVDGAENNPPSYENTKHYEVAKYYSLDEHTRVPEIVLCSKRTWDRLAPADRALLRKAAQASVTEQRRLWREYTAKACAPCERPGSRSTPPTSPPFARRRSPCTGPMSPSTAAW